MEYTIMLVYKVTGERYFGRRIMADNYEEAIKKAKELYPTIPHCVEYGNYPNLDRKVKDIN